MKSHMYNIIGSIVFLIFGMTGKYEIFISDLLIHTTTRSNIFIINNFHFQNIQEYFINKNLKCECFNDTVNNYTYLKD